MFSYCVVNGDNFHTIVFFVWGSFLSYFCWIKTIGILKVSMFFKINDKCHSFETKKLSFYYCVFQ